VPQLPRGAAKRGVGKLEQVASCREPGELINRYDEVLVMDKREKENR
jgi:hypothetical protein